jgi:hypothetical protein
MEDKFLMNYRSMVADDFEEDYMMFRSIKRTTNSYIKRPNTDKLHSIYNRIVVLRRSFHESFLFEQIIRNNDSDDGKNLIGYFISESFDINGFYDEDKIDDLWIIQISDLLDNTKIKARV